MRQVTNHSVGTRGLITQSLATGVTDTTQRDGRIGPLQRFLNAGFSKRATVLVLLALTVSGIGHVINTPARNESREVGELVESLIDRPADYVVDTGQIGQRLGYLPAVESGSWVSPDGTCSTPLPIGPDEFGSPCRSHDLGYDALRLAAGDHADLGGWARAGLDARLYADLLATCEDTRCRVTATVFFGAVSANSIRQGYRAPTREPVLPWAGLGLATLGLAAVPARWSDHRPGRHPSPVTRSQPWVVRMAPTRGIARSGGSPRRPNGR